MRGLFHSGFAIFLSAGLALAAPPAQIDGNLLRQAVTTHIQAARDAQPPDEAARKQEIKEGNFHVSTLETAALRREFEGQVISLTHSVKRQRYGDAGPSPYRKHWFISTHEELTFEKGMSLPDLHRALAVPEPSDELAVPKILTRFAEVLKDEKVPADPRTLVVEKLTFGCSPGSSLSGSLSESIWVWIEFRDLKNGSGHIGLTRYFRSKGWSGFPSQDSQMNVAAPEYRLSENAFEFSGGGWSSR